MHENLENEKKYTDKIKLNYSLGSLTVVPSKYVYVLTSKTSEYELI